jgi:hypothetical protein
MTEDIPCSFRYDGKLLCEHDVDWPYIGKDSRQHSASELTVTEQVIRYEVAPVVEWRLWFGNRGETDSPRLSLICLGQDCPAAGHNRIF